MNARIAFAPVLLSSFAASADYRVEMNTIGPTGPVAHVGSVTVTAAGSTGVTFTPNLQGLPAGTHGFHVHEFANCGARSIQGRMEPGEMAGPHYDPKKARKHAGPKGDGHLGDLPALVVDASGKATQAVTAPRLTLKELDGRALVVHEGGDNNADQPKPNGGGGKRIACGVIAK